MDTKALRQKILDLAIRGKLVPQDPNDEPASVLLERIRAEKQQMVKDGKLKAKDIFRRLIQLSLAALAYGCLVYMSVVAAHSLEKIEIFKRLCKRLSADTPRVVYVAFWYIVLLPYALCNRAEGFFNFNAPEHLSRAGNKRFSHNPHKG